MARVKQSVIAKRQVEVLAYLFEEAELRGGAAAPLSLRTICASRGLSESQVRLILKTLKQEGLLEVQPRTLPNGGTAENAYLVTRQGRLALQAYLAAAASSQLTPAAC